MTTPSDDLRRRLLAGEPITTRQAVDDYGVSTSLVGVIVAQLERDGATIHREREHDKRGVPAVFTVTSPKPDPALRSSWGKGSDVRKLGNRGGAGVARPSKGKAKAKSKRQASAAVANASPAAIVRAHVNGSPKGTDHPVPVLGENLQVFLLALTDDGRVNVGLRDGEQTWLTTVDGFATR